MSKNILGITGSPRKSGNTDILIDNVIKGAVENGASPDKVYLYDMDIKPCIACDTCISAENCIYDDDMKKMIEKLKWADILVFGTPVYWWGPTAAFKAFMDRWYDPNVRKEIKNKKIIITIPLEDTEEATAKHTAGMLKDALEYIGTDIRNIIVAYGVREKGSVLEEDDVLNEAYESGKNSVV